MQMMDYVIKRSFSVSSACVQAGTTSLVTLLDGTAGVIATAVLKGYLYVTRLGSSQVWVYETTSFEIKRQITSPDFGTILFGLAACVIKNYLFIADRRVPSIHRVDLSVTATNNVSSWSVMSDPNGLSTTSAGNLLVAHGDRVVREYTSEGTLIRQITDSNAVWQSLEVNPGVWVYSRRDPVHDILMKFSNGTTIRSYGSAVGSGIIRMYWPTCLAIDPHGYIIVADCGYRRILVVDPTMTDARELPLPADITLQSPWALSLDSTRGRLYVGENGGQNRVLIFDGVTNLHALFNN